MQVSLMAPASWEGNGKLDGVNTDTQHEKHTHYFYNAFAKIKYTIMNRHAATGLVITSNNSILNRLSLEPSDSGDEFSVPQSDTEGLGRRPL